MKTNIGLFLAKRARLEPDKPGLIFEGRTFTYHQYNQRANQAAHAFAALGVRKGDRVGVLSMNHPAFLETYFGLAKIGAIMTTVNFRLAPPEMAYICQNSGMRALVYGAEFAQAVEAFKSKVEIQDYILIGGETPSWARDYEAFIADQSVEEPGIAAEGDDPLVIMYTSGTTGRPKGAVLTHNNLFYAASSVIMNLDFRITDRVLVVMPLYHIGALIYSTINVYRGCTTVLMKAFDPAAMLETIQREKVTTFMAVPTMLQFILQLPSLDQYDLSSVRWLLGGAAPVPVPLIQAYAQRGIAIQNVYGLTESTGPGTVIGPEKAIEKAGSAGLPFFHVDLRVVDDQGNDVQAGEIGEVLLWGPHIMQEYWQNPEATAETVVDGWLHTGDLARVDEDGYIYIVDRKKDMISSGGENIYPVEVENVLYGHPKVLQVAVIGVPDETWGEVPCTIVRLKEGQMATAEEIIKFCEGKLARFKIPKSVVFVKEPLPVSPTGKVLKYVLREQYGRP